MTKSKVLKILKWFLIALFAIAAVFTIVFKVYTSRYYRTDKDTVNSIVRSLESKVNTYSDDNGMVFIPRNQEYEAVIVFYPGGKVEYTAYSGLMYELASRGYVCLLPRMPDNLAFLRINAVDVFIGGYEAEVGTAKELDWYLAGHSLGGVAASLFLEETDDEYDGLILCASYPNADISGSDYRFLSIIGSEDKVVNKKAYDNARTYWPEHSEEYIIEGGIHSYFGCYGIQKGDGVPAVSNQEQIAETADIIANWIEKK